MQKQSLSNKLLGELVTRKDVKVTRGGKVFIDGIEAVQHDNHKGYKFIKIQYGKKFVPLFVHRIVLAYNYGMAPFAAGYQTNHLNGVKSDNRLKNLEFITASQNAAHARDVLRSTNAKLTKEQVIWLRKERPLTAKAAKALNVKPATISAAKHLRTYKDLYEPVDNSFLADIIEAEIIEKMKKKAS